MNKPDPEIPTDVIPAVKSHYASPNNPVSDDNNPVTPVIKGRFGPNGAALAEGLGVFEEVFEDASVALLSSSSVVGALGIVCSVGSVSRVGAAISLGTWPLACILNDPHGSGAVGVGVTFACSICVVC